MGGRDLPESGFGERPSGLAGGTRRLGRRTQGGAVDPAGSSGVHRELVGGAAGSQATGDGLSAAGGGGWALGHLGSSAQRLSRGRTAALLEPQDPQCARQATEATAGQR